VGHFPHSLVARKLGEDAQVAKADLKCLDEDAIVGNYTIREMQQGEVIGPDDVTAAQHTIPHASLAVLAPMKIPSGRSRIDAGDRVRLCVDGKLVKDDAEVQASVCDTYNCLLTVAVDDTKDYSPAGAIQHLKAIQISDLCSAK
jgi:hypothetical protein